MAKKTGQFYQIINTIDYQIVIIDIFNMERLSFTSCCGNVEVFSEKC